MINYNNLGDLICDTPSIRNIRKNFLNNYIILLVRNKSCIELMEKCPYVDETIEMPHSRDSLFQFYKFIKKMIKYNYRFSIQFVRPFKEIKRTYIPFMMGIKKRYGLIQKGYEKYYKKAFTDFNLLSNTTTRVEESLLITKKIGIKIKDDYTECWINEEELNHVNYENYIIIQTCATMESRMWHSSLFVEVIDNILENYSNIKILLTGVKSEYDYVNNIKKCCDKKYKNRIIVLCNINISTLLNYIRNSRLLITNDTGPYHFAKALKIPIIVLFGISPKEYLIKRDRSDCIALKGNNLCINCKIKSLNDKNCIEKYKLGSDSYNCINTIDVKEVLKNVKIFLK